MADVTDIASNYEELERMSAIYHNRKGSDNSVKPTGYCLYCHETLEDGRRWCNAECRDDWEREQR